MAKNKNAFYVIGGLVVLGIILLGSNTLTSFFIPQNGRSTRDVAFSCTTDAFTRFHIHPELSIIINGAQTVIPANIGVSLTCLRPVHTHEAGGVIHIESPVKLDFILGDFFAVWNKKFSKNQILNQVLDENHEIIMTVDGEKSEAYENLVLEDNQKIVIEYKTKNTNTQ